MRSIKQALRFTALLSAFLVSAPAHSDDAPDLRLEMRYGDYPARPNLVDQTALYATSLTSWLRGEFGARFSESALNLQSFEYKAEVQTTLISFFSLGVRLENSWYTADGTGSTNFLFRANLHGTPFRWLYLHATGGWYERFTTLNGFALFPTFSRDTADHDFAVMAGWEVRPEDNWGVGGMIATFEAINTFNFNNPYAQLSARYFAGEDIGEIYLYARYRLLLGFGRLDEFLVGVGWKVPLGT